MSGRLFGHIIFYSDILIFNTCYIDLIKKTGGQSVFSMGHAMSRLDKIMPFSL
jgi:hypothetical protein